MSAAAVSGPAFELKGRMTTLTVLRVHTSDVQALLMQLDAKLAQAPGFFAGMPITIAPAEGVILDATTLDQLVAGLRARDWLPVAASDVDADLAASAGLGLLRDQGQGRTDSTNTQPQSQSQSQSQPPAAASRLVTQPIRSGQQVYARGGDLIVTAAVSAGAELMADGNIHIYGTLRGRALAGVQGSTDARIFCQSLEAELVAIGGHYQLSEQIDAGLRGRSVMISLQDEDLQFKAL